jgi:tetratricopeptide (TPR) repeat protein
MLFHLILWTPAGRLLLDRKRVLQMGQEADDCHGRADFEKEIELKETMLQRSLAFGQDNAFMIAACHQGLGTAYTLVGDWPAAEFQYRKCLECEAEVAGNPALEANVRSGLFRAVVHRHHISAAGPTYTSLVALLEKQKAATLDLTGPAIGFALLAQAHLYHGDFEAALGEIEQALKTLPGGERGHSLRAHMLRAKAVCHLRLDEVETGLDATRAAAALFRSAAVPAARRNLAGEDIADLGAQLWSTGQANLATELLREGIANLESGGALGVAALYRVRLAAILRQRGFPDEARAVLPVDRALSPALRRAFLAESVELHLLGRRPDLAVTDCRELVALWRAHPCAPAPEIASAEALLAKACLAADEPAEATTLAQAAVAVLGAWQHPDAASCLVTLALTQEPSADEPQADRFAEALRLIDSAALLTPAERVRFKEALATRIPQAASAASSV